MRISDLKLGIRLSLAFGLMILLSLLIASQGILRISSLKSNTEELATTEIERQTLVQEWFTDIEMNWLRTEALFKANSGNYAQQLRLQMTAVVETQSKRMELVKNHLRGSEEKRLYSQVIEARDRFRAKRLALDNELKKGEDVSGKTDSELQPVFKAYEEALTEFKTYLGTTLANEQSANLNQADVSLNWLVLGALASAAAGFVLAWRTTRSITRPVGQAVSVARSIAQGDLTVSIPSGSRDEAGQLLDALSDMQQRLAEIVATVRVGAEGVANTSAEIAQGNSDLSTRTEQQASALQQTAASMEQLGSTVQQNAENARTANQLALSASNVAAKGGQVVSEVVHTMKGINDSSRRIADIIGVIDGIAFQTNILALNAAVEAARAGEQGRGFAVVAGEVRSLAHRSADAAKEIKILIGTSVERVEQGAMLVDHAGETMNDVVASIRRVTDLMGEISAASVEQSTGVGQVGEAVIQMDQTTQQNAALVEQSAAAAASLRAQAEHLVQIVSVFKLASNQALGLVNLKPAPSQLLS